MHCYSDRNAIAPAARWHQSYDSLSAYSSSTSIKEDNAIYTPFRPDDHPIQAIPFYKLNLQTMYLTGRT